MNHNPPLPPRETLSLTVHSAQAGDADRGYVRLDPASLEALGLGIGDFVSVAGTASAYGRAMPMPAELRGRRLVAIDDLQRQNAGLSVGLEARVARAEPAVATRIELDGLDAAAAMLPANVTPGACGLEHLALHAGQQVRLTAPGGRVIRARVRATTPEGPVVIRAATAVSLLAPAAKPAKPRHPDDIRYADLGGLSREVARVREMVEWPMHHAGALAELGISPPKGVLLVGPPGTGKTQLARAVANEASATFFQINGPEIVSKHYGESEEQLRAIFRKAEAKAPSIIFIDEIDAIAPKRDGLAGDRQVERRIVAQLLTLLDGMNARGQVVVMAATNLPSALDPALRRPGRFDRELVFSPPDRAGREEILRIHARAMPLAPEVDLAAIAGATHGYVGADLAALVREAGMAAFRRHMAKPGGMGGPARVTPADFAQAMREIGPSAMREVALDMPTTRFEDVGGTEALKQTLIESVIWPMRHPELFAEARLSAGGGVLLYGPPGTGKTLLAKALAHEAGANFIGLRGPQLVSAYLGESEKAIRDLFQRARMLAPAILFFDEIDALAPRRSASAHSAVERIVGQLLTELDGLEERRGVFVLGATNRPEAIDPALLRPGRFDQLIEVPVPDAVAREQIFRIHLNNRPLDASVDPQALARASDGAVGADIEAICRVAALAAVRRSLAASPAIGAGRPAMMPIGQADLLAALAAFRQRWKHPEPTDGTDRRATEKQEGCETMTGEQP